MASGAILIGFALIWIIQPVYELSALLLVKFGQQQVYRSPVGLDATPIAAGGSQLSDDMVNTQVQMLQSRDVIEPVIKKISIARLYPDIVENQQSVNTPRSIAGLSHYIVEAQKYFSGLCQSIIPSYVTWSSGGSEMDRAVRRFTSDLSIQQARASLLIQVRYRNPNFTLARVALEDLIQEHRDVSAAIDGNEQVKFYASALVQTKQKLENAEIVLNRFRSEVGVVAFKEQQPMLLQQRQKVEEEHGSLTRLLAGVERRNAKLVQQLGTLPGSVTAYTETHSAYIRLELLGLSGILSLLVWSKRFSRAKQNAPRWVDVYRRHRSS